MALRKAGAPGQLRSRQVLLALQPSHHRAESFLRHRDHDILRRGYKRQKRRASPFVLRHLVQARRARVAAPHQQRGELGRLQLHAEPCPTDHDVLATERTMNSGVGALPKSAMSRCPGQ